jgi:hypothetical protein
LGCRAIFAGTSASEGTLRRLLAGRMVTVSAAGEVPASAGTGVGIASAGTGEYGNGR